MILQILDIPGIVIVSVVFYSRYKISFADGYNPISQLHLMIPVIIMAISLLSAQKIEV